MNVRFDTHPSQHGKQIGLATLDSPASLNALSLPMIEALLDHLDRWAHDPTIVCVLLRATGDKAFCAGGDVRQLALACLDQPGRVPPLAARFFADEYRLDFRLHRFPKPLLCWGHGYVLGGGMGLLQAAGIRIVTPGSQLGMPEIGIGLYPDVGAGWFLPRLPGRMGLFLALTGSRVNATDALDLGLADRCLRDDQQPALLDGLAQINWDEQAPAQLNSLLKALELDAREARPEALLASRRAVIDRDLDVADLPAAWHAIAAWRNDQDAVLAQAAETLMAGCPLTAHLIWAQFRHCRYRSLAEILRLEYGMSLNCCRHPEFAEGVRGRLIEKRPPHWHWPTIDSVPTTVVDAHFEPSWDGPHPLADLV
ncbi:enoyl-CoA hydratase/isomerase family protein [Stutzerimonas urumqiensis]|uniref:enoyl-CoA hydratase/isomerase family protein n=1 Tax=Stutzerimonas urumqiensis TaxID=638269 RepID=UPI000EB14F29|nr:enoyl-CoA hydratase/isomerase family protein [Stutzerimonas urumqiensis]